MNFSFLSFRSIQIYWIRDHLGCATFHLTRHFRFILSPEPNHNQNPNTDPNPKPKPNSAMAVTCLLKIKGREMNCLPALAQL